MRKRKLLKVKRKAAASKKRTAHSYGCILDGITPIYGGKEPL